MTFDWYLLFNLDEFLSSNLVSRKLTLVLEGAGEKEVLIVRANEVSLVYDDCLLPLDFEGDPFIQQGPVLKYASYVGKGNNVYLGIEVP